MSPYFKPFLYFPQSFLPLLSWEIVITIIKRLTFHLPSAPPRPRRGTFIAEKSHSTSSHYRQILLCLKDSSTEKEIPSPFVDAVERADSSHSGGLGKGHLLKTLQEDKGKTLQLKPACQQGSRFHYLFPWAVVHTIVLSRWKNLSNYNQELRVPGAAERLLESKQFLWIGL